MLKSKDLALVINKLQVPLIVSDVLWGEASLTDDVQYGLHEVISDLQPDSALLCVALSAKKIAAQFSKVSASMQVLEMECGRIVEDYAELWLQNAQAGNVSEIDALDAVSRTAEDLEGIAELLELNMGSLREKNTDAFALCEVLSVQARAHALIAETYMEALEGALESVPEVAPAVANAASNVIPFPAGKRA